MSTAINRMQFLSGDYSGRKSPLRPPWAIDEFLFISICNACGECIKQCPTKIIKPGRGNFPVVDFESGECLFCGDCVSSCKPDALTQSSNHLPWQITASINEANCLAFHNIECRSCYDPCEPRAINITLQRGSVSIPIIDKESCTGCGACLSVCPAQSIEIQLPKEAT